MYEIVTDSDRKTFQEEFANRLPQKIFDAHVHIVKKSSCPPDFKETSSYMEKFGYEFTVDDFFKIAGDLLPGIELSLCGFGMPRMNMDRTDAADMKVDNKRIFGMRLISAYDDVEKVEEDILKYKLCGAKPYHTMAFQPTDRAGELLDFFTPEQLKMLNRLKLAITVHIPRKMRLEDPLNRKQMAYLCETYPDITFIFAHIGRAYYKRCAVGYVDEFVKYPNAFWDTAMLNSVEVFKYTFDHFPKERILFGTDMPISALHGKSVEINNQYLYLTPEKFNMGTAVNDFSNQVIYSPFLYEQLRSILELNMPQQDLEDFMYNRAFNLFSSITERMYNK